MSTIGFLWVKWTLGGDINYLLSCSPLSRAGHWVRRPQEQKAGSGLAEVGLGVVGEEGEPEPDPHRGGGPPAVSPKEELIRDTGVREQHVDACPQDMLARQPLPEKQQQPREGHDGCPGISLLPPKPTEGARGLEEERTELGKQTVLSPTANPTEAEQRQVRKH